MRKRGQAVASITVGGTMRVLGLTLLAVGVVLLGANSARADLVFVTDIQISGTGLGAVNTLVTVHDPGGPGNQNDTESGCINQDGSFSPCLTATGGATGVEGGDNTAINEVRTFDTNDSFAAVVNIAETGQDLTVTLTALYLTFCSTTSPASCYTAEYLGPDKQLTQGGSEGTGLGNSGFTFALTAAEFASVVALPGDLVAVSGGLQFLNGSTNDGNDTLHVIEVTGPTVVPEPATLFLLGSGLAGFGAWSRRRRSRG